VTREALTKNTWPSHVTVRNPGFLPAALRPQDVPFYEDFDRHMVEQIRKGFSDSMARAMAPLATESGDLQSSLKPLRLTYAPKSWRSGRAYCRALSSDQP